MGDPKKPQKKYQRPAHPWQKARIDDEKRLMRDYGLATKKELWKVDALLRTFKNQAKKLTVGNSLQIEKEKKDMFARLSSYGLMKGTATLDDILSLTLNDLLERRLQTIVFRKGFARTMTQARQFIIHKHILINDKKISAPTYMVKTAEEGSIVFCQTSTLSKDDHPERIIIKRAPKEEKPEDQKDRQYRPKRKPVRLKK